MSIPAKQATNLKEALNVFDPRAPLQGESLKAFYVERPASPLAELRVGLQFLSKPGKFLFTGPRGSGKSTELHRLVEQEGMGDQFFVTHFSVIDALNPHDLQYIDLLLGTANQVFNNATSQEILPRGVTQIIKDDLLDEIYQWFTRDLLHEVPFRSPKPEWSLAAKVNFLAVELEGKLNNEPRTRQIVRERTELRLNELLDNLNYVLDEVRRQANREPLIIIEDIDKLDLKLARDMYFQHAASLTAPKAHIIYTFPIALRYTNDFIQIRRNFDEDITLPNIKVTRRDGAADAEGQAMLRQVVLERMQAGLIAEEAITLLVTMSGGIPVTLIDLTQRAILYALTQDKAKIERPDVERAIDKERADYQVVLTQDHLALLRRRAVDKAIVNDDLDRECLHNLSLIEYRNARPWRDVHPIVRDLLNETES